MAGVLGRFNLRLKAPEGPQGKSICLVSTLKESEGISISVLHVYHTEQVIRGFPVTKHCVSAKWMIKVRGAKTQSLVGKVRLMREV